MTQRALAGIVGLNALVLVVGSGLLWGFRGWRAWTDLVRLAGLAYLLGAASLFVVFTFELVVGVPFGVTSMLSTGLALAAGGIVVGSLRGHERPAVAPPGWRFPRPSILDAFFIAALVVCLQALVRSGRLQGPGPDWDAWRAWTLRAKSIYYSGHLDETIPSIGQYPSYPPGLSALQAAAFHAMGSADTITLHQLNAYLAVGFVAAVAGLLASRVHKLILLPFLLVLFVMPHGLPEWGTQLMADLPMGFFLATAALLVALWFGDRQGWRLGVAAVLLGGAMLTKREGIMFAAIIVCAALAASWRERRAAWPALATMGLTAFALAIPWRIWFTTAGVPSDAPESGYLGFLSDLDRVWPALRLVVSSMFTYDYWLVVPTLGLVACALALAAGARRLPIFMLVIVAASIAGSTWVIASNPIFGLTRDYGLNPVGRLVGGTVLMLAVATPLLLERAWSGARYRATPTVRAPVTPPCGESERPGRSSSSRSSGIPHRCSQEPPCYGFPAASPRSRALTSASVPGPAVDRLVSCWGTRRASCKRLRSAKGLVLRGSPERRWPQTAVVAFESS